MPKRIPEEEIDRIKHETDLAALVRSRGIELKTHGSKDLIGPCPFHEDNNTPNLIVSPDKGLYHCMACGVAGNVIQFVQKYDGVSFRHAFEVLNEGLPAFSAVHNPTRWDTGDEALRPLKKATVRRLESPVKHDAEDTELLNQVVDYYHERLLKTPLALDYLKSRGIYSEEAIKTFRLGYADRTLGLRLPEKSRKEGAAIRERLIKLGLLRDTGHEHFNGSIVMPIFDEQGHVVEMYGRKNRKVTPPSLPHLYLPGPHAGIWNLPAVATGELILCEAPLDALTFWVNGIRNITFIFGTEGFPSYLFEAILKHHVKTVRLAYDADEAGERAAKRDTDKLTAHGIEVYRVKFPWGMDVNSFACQSKEPAKDLRIAVESAEWHGNISLAENAESTEHENLAHAHAGASSSKELAANINLAACSEPGRGASQPETANQKSEPSSHLPPATCHLSLSRQGDYHTLTLGPREYRVGGLDKNNSLEVLKVAVRLRVDERFHLDSFDMTRDNERRRFVDRAAEETGLEKELIKRDLGKLLLALEDAQQQRLTAAIEPTGKSAPAMTAAEQTEAMTLLTSPDLLAKIGEAFDAYGLVGEESKRLAAYLACTSRKLDKPLAVIIQSTSAAGKTALMEAVLAMFPEEERIKYSAMTGQSLFYLGETDLKHKILAIVEEEGAEKASYALKLLQSEGELTIASTGKNPQTGRMETQEYHVEGPVMIFLTTTAIDIDEELQNRCLMLTVDETRAQTERIHARQRESRTLEGLRRKKHKKSILQLMRNAQRLIKPVEIMNPYSRELTFTADKTRTRRDHEKYLGLIDAIALLHQHQRVIESDPALGGTGPETCPAEGGGGQFIRVTLDDIELANKLAPELLGRSLDELPPQTRRLLSYIKELVLQRCKTLNVEPGLSYFSRKDLRDASGWSEFQVRVHLEKLETFEYIGRRWGRQGKQCSYELLIDPTEPDNLCHIGLLDVAKLRARKPATTTRTSCTQEATSGNFVKMPSRSVKGSVLVACV